MSKININEMTIGEVRELAVLFNGARFPECDGPWKLGVNLLHSYRNYVTNWPADSSLSYRVSFGRRCMGGRHGTLRPGRKKGRL